MIPNEVKTTMENTPFVHIAWTNMSILVILYLHILLPSDFATQSFVECMFTIRKYLRT